MFPFIFYLFFLGKHYPLCISFVSYLYLGCCQMDFHKGLLSLLGLHVCESDLNRSSCGTGIMLCKGAVSLICKHCPGIRDRS